LCCFFDPVERVDRPQGDEDAAGVNAFIEARVEDGLLSTTVTVPLSAR